MRLAGFSVAVAGWIGLVFGRLRKKPHGARGGTAAGRGPRPRPRGRSPGSVQSEEYRTADPRELVEADGVVMGGPGGAPQEGESVEERLARDRED